MGEKCSQCQEYDKIIFDYINLGWIVAPTMLMNQKKMFYFDAKVRDIFVQECSFCESEPFSSILSYNGNYYGSQHKAIWEPPHCDISYGNLTYIHGTCIEIPELGNAILFVNNSLIYFDHTSIKFNRYRDSNVYITKDNKIMGCFRDQDDNILIIDLDSNLVPYNILYNIGSTEGDFVEFADKKFSLSVDKTMRIAIFKSHNGNHTKPAF